MDYLDKRLFKYNVRTSDSDNILQIVNSSIEDTKGTYEVYPTKLTFNIEYKTQSELGSLLKTNERNKVRLLNTYVSKNNQEITSIVNKLVKNLNRWYSGNLINQEIKITNE
ncbi:hypothetical protein HYO65_gp228 [Tenacibaculum phage PTm1]|uniref:Uncharacterized protein n=1 Tax=Tenacibaculum phage PTm1 TaxID=2547425 RepID=A0A5S9BZ60_9CAUD|nr:hypothetical protein HYO65_gp228 [Tenacibaculum phage PTm1]BBI90620.1 hypothetical protein [Tenacibaculum phage PTm1]